MRCEGSYGLWPLRTRDSKLDSRDVWSGRMTEEEGDWERGRGGGLCRVCVVNGPWWDVIFIVLFILNSVDWRTELSRYAKWPHLGQDQTYAVASCTDMRWYTFDNCSWVDTRWQQYSTQLHTNSIQNNTMKRNTQSGTYIIKRVHKHNYRNT